MDKQNKLIQLVQRNNTDWDVYDSNYRIFKIRGYNNITVLIGNTEDTKNINLKFDYIEDAVAEAFERIK